MGKQLDISQCAVFVEDGMFDNINALTEYSKMNKEMYVDFNKEFKDHITDMKQLKQFDLWNAWDHCYFNSIIRSQIKDNYKKLEFNTESRIIPDVGVHESYLNDVQVRMIPN